MSSSQRRSSLVLATVALLMVATHGAAECPPLPDHYRDLEYGAVRLHVEESCRSTFSKNEQFFLAGVAHVLLRDCKLPRDPATRTILDRFARAAMLSLDLRKPQQPLDARLPSETDDAKAFAAGTTMMEGIRCNGPDAALLARGIVIYLKRTSGTSLFVAGCVATYPGRYADKECRCIANALRRVSPDVDDRFFDRELVKQSIHRSPRVAVRLMLSCGVTSY